MSDTSSYNVQAPQTYVLSAFAARRLYQNLSQTAPTHMAGQFRQAMLDWEKEATQRAFRFTMKQMPITKAY
jgi:hypothetical protein